MNNCADCGSPALAACNRCAPCLLLWHGLQSDPEMIRPAPVTPPRSIFDGVMIAIREKEGGDHGK